MQSRLFDDYWRMQLDVPFLIGTPWFISVIQVCFSLFSREIDWEWTKSAIWRVKDRKFDVLLRQARSPLTTAFPIFRAINAIAAPDDNRRYGFGWFESLLLRIPLSYRLQAFSSIWHVLQSWIGLNVRGEGAICDLEEHQPFFFTSVCACGWKGSENISWLRYWCSGIFGINDQSVVSGMLAVTVTHQNVCGICWSRPWATLSSSPSTSPVRKLSRGFRMDNKMRVCSGCGWLSATPCSLLPELYLHGVLPTHANRSPTVMSREKLMGKCMREMVEERWDSERRDEWGWRGEWTVTMWWLMEESWR